MNAYIPCPDCGGSGLEGVGSEEPCNLCRGKKEISTDWPDTPDLITTSIRGLYWVKPNEETVG